MVQSKGFLCVISCLTFFFRKYLLKVPQDILEFLSKAEVFAILGPSLASLGHDGLIEEDIKKFELIDRSDLSSLVEGIKVKRIRDKTISFWFKKELNIARIASSVLRFNLWRRNCIRYHIVIEETARLQINTINTIGSIAGRWGCLSHKLNGAHALAFGLWPREAIKQEKCSFF